MKKLFSIFDAIIEYITVCAVKIQGVCIYCLFAPISVITVFTFISCDKAFENGDLDGMWHLQRVHSEEESYEPKSIYYSFQRHLVQVSKHYEIELPLRYLGMLNYRGDTISMSRFKSFPHETHTPTTEELKEFFIYSDSTTFIINTLNDDMLIMTNNGMTYTLRRW